MASSQLKGRIKLIAISGAARSGKDTLANALSGQFGYRKYSFAEPIYRMLNTLPYLEHINSNISTEEKEKDHPFYGRSPRRLLQTLGTEWGRDLVGHDIWVNIINDKLERKQAITGHAAYVISDLRFENEAAWVHMLGGICVRVSRGAATAVSSHVSENGIRDSLINKFIVNNETIEALCQQASSLDDLAEEHRRQAAA